MHSRKSYFRSPLWVLNWAIVTMTVTAPDWVILAGLNDGEVEITRKQENTGLSLTWPRSYDLYGLFCMDSCSQARQCVCSELWSAALGWMLWAHPCLRQWQYELIRSDYCHSVSHQCVIRKSVNHTMKFCPEQLSYYLWRTVFLYFLSVVEEKKKQRK